MKAVLEKKSLAARAPKIPQVLRVGDRVECRNPELCVPSFAIASTGIRVLSSLISASCRPLAERPLIGSTAGTYS